MSGSVVKELVPQMCKGLWGALGMSLLWCRRAGGGAVWGGRGGPCAVGGKRLQGCGCAVQNSTGMDLIFLSILFHFLPLQTSKCLRKRWVYTTFMEHPDFPFITAIWEWKVFFIQITLYRHSVLKKRGWTFDIIFICTLKAFHGLGHPKQGITADPAVQAASCAQCCGMWVTGGPSGPSSPSGLNDLNGPNGSSQHCHFCFTFEPFIEDVAQSAPEPQSCPVFTLWQIYPGFISTCKVFGPAV